jgi:4-alpha-glucanotransferase
VGELGPEALRWLDLLAAAGQRVWQVLPLGPTGYGDSPYQSFSTFAGNPYLIDVGDLAAEGLLRDDDLEPLRALPSGRVDYGGLYELKLPLLRRAADAFLASGGAGDPGFRAFAEREAAWLEDFALFMALKEEAGGAPWTAWERPLRLRDPAALADAAERLVAETARQRVWQYWFSRQWSAVKGRASERGIRVLGDVPIFVALDSADVWANPELFHLGGDGLPTVVAGVPPDYFSATGQRWGNPLYRWDVMRERGYAWWVARLRHALAQADLVRIDHFRGFAAYWEIPAGEPTAERGRWVAGPGADLFDALRRELGGLPVVAEDLGVITPDVEALRDSCGLPGMKVLQFAFAGGADDPYLPHNYERDCVVYTGTHDNDTTRGWYESAPEAERDHVRRYLGRPDEDVVDGLVRLAYASVADLAVVPLQDHLGLGPEARMNTPGREVGNWTWRFAWDDVPPWLAPHLHGLASVYGRVPAGGPVDTPYRRTAL